MSCFITFEGIEGCGKTTQVELLSRFMKDQDIPSIFTREPGGCVISNKIRDILLDAENRKLVPLAELLLYAAARTQHVEEVIRPSISEGKIVICDRFTDATIAYQGFGRSLDLDLICNLNRLASGGLVPNLTILLDCPEELGLRRAQERIQLIKGAREERFEKESLRFHHAVREGYLHLAANSPERFVVLDASKEISETAFAVREVVLSRIGRG